MQILILGHKGLLGNCVYSWLIQKPKFNVITCDYRWPSNDFKAFIKNSGVDFIINCIGCIPQKKPTEKEYVSINTNLPLFLETIGIPILHPSTDCEFYGNKPIGQLYSKYETKDAQDAYGKSKAAISNQIEQLKFTKILRTSIIGHELNSSFSLLEWFLSTNGSINGFNNHFWNGITTLEWAKIAETILTNWHNHVQVIQVGTEPISKYGLVSLFKEVYKHNVTIVPIAHKQSKNKCLESDWPLKDLKTQLTELKSFYQR